MSQPKKYRNRLAQEKSPYLLQHANNPVDWYPWGSEAFAAAHDQGRPIFLSIGYATCHWCHVMERESFEDPVIAELLNRTFINVKVDREELPEVDSLYMELAQAMMSGASGWPLNVVLTPELRPFFAATYLPPVARCGLMSFEEAIVRIQQMWRDPDEREHVELQAERVVSIFGDQIYLQGEQLPSQGVIGLAAELIFKLADPIYGGSQGAPKFPIAYQINWMLRHASGNDDSRALFLVEKTLKMMHRGGIYDHLGGGFARYAVDERWEVPHFEKMLCDNAQLAYSYLEAWVALKKPLYRQVCCETLDYLLREMVDPAGGFFSAQDADSEGKEGYFYTWECDEVTHFLGHEESDYFRSFYGITPEGNFEGRNVLHATTTVEAFAAGKGVDPVVLSELFSQQRALLFEVRSERVAPFKDDKILASWNGLAICAFAEAGSVFGDVRYRDAALNAARFVRETMWDGSLLYRRWREGERSYPSGLQDYASIIRAAIQLFEVSGDCQWLEWAIEMSQLLARDFKSDEGAFYQTDGGDPHLIVRSAEYSDGAEPSGNALHCENLLRLYQLTADPHYLKQAEDIFRAVTPFIEEHAPSHCYHLAALTRYYDKKAPTYIIAAAAHNQKEADSCRDLLAQVYIPHKAVITYFDDDEQIGSLLPILKNKRPVEGQTTLYICRAATCSAPIIGKAAIDAAVAAL